ncbi:nucleolar protein 11 [Anthonomus grandis grandis]|uniref:nucleolar protein 11 n=1 Tax=Anthonomus grandis grandis TaxID=2921223 RepID=UPI002165C79D|nr:nucleolar protein 11 [Anthonomus grandis grandis]
MAKLLSYYSLCPLIDTKNLLGISEDLEKGAVIVTLGKNIAIKYRLSDQKQVCSWRSKEKFSSPVVFDKKLEKYVAVFNQNFVRIWTDEDETLDKIKKYKFNHPIYTILEHNGETFVVFQSGSVYSLNDILESRKSFTPVLIVDGGEICDVVYKSVDEDLYLGLLVSDKDSITFYWTVYTHYSKNSFYKNKLLVSNVTLKGYSLYVMNKKVHLLTVWSDCKIYIKELIQFDKELSDVGELLTVLENISPQHLVKVLTLDERYIAIYGSDPNEEGAVLLIYNTQFKVTQSRQLHKLYTKEAKIWKMFNTIMLPVGQNLIVVPFCLDSEQLVALVGSHKPLPNKIDSDVAFVTDFEVANWMEELEGEKRNEQKSTKGKLVPKSLKHKLEEHMHEGLAEAVILDQILPEILEEGTVELVKDVLKFFTDIPEKHLAKILHFVLSCNKRKFKEDPEFSKNIPIELLPSERVKLVDTILINNFNDNLLLPYLRSELNIDQATTLLQYFTHLLSEEGHNLPALNALKTEKCVIKWISVIIDANYQKFALTKDEKVEKALTNCWDAVSEHLEVIDSLQTVMPVLTRIDAEAKGKGFASGGLGSSAYVIEQISL